MPVGNPKSKIISTSHGGSICITYDRCRSRKGSKFSFSKVGRVIKYVSGRNYAIFIIRRIREVGVLNEELRSALKLCLTQLNAFKASGNVLIVNEARILANK
jgi:hypothetical protein